MKHLDQRIYAGTAVLAAIAAAVVLYATHPVDLAVIESANAMARTGAPMVTWKGMRNVVMHDAATTALAATSDK
ncbi:MAG: hypothetical protein U1F48_11365 [Burkholderiales bacterium]